MVIRRCSHGAADDRHTFPGILRVLCRTGELTGKTQARNENSPLKSIERTDDQVRINRVRRQRFGRMAYGTARSQWHTIPLLWPDAALVEPHRFLLSPIEFHETILPRVCLTISAVQRFPAAVSIN